MSYIDVIYNSIVAMHKVKKYHCDSCGHFTKSEEYHKRPQGTCSMRDGERAYEKEWCKHHTSSRHNKKYWKKFTHYECPVCGAKTREEETMYTPRPDDRKERNFYKQRYDNCMEK